MLRSAAVVLVLIVLAGCGYAQNAMAKLGARTRAHVVAIALVTGQVNWSICDLSDPVAPSEDEPESK